MYTTYPLATEYPDHIGFFLFLTLSIVVWICCLYHAKEERWNVFVLTVLIAIFPTFSYFVSYKWTNQEPIVYKNEKHIGTFVRFIAEGHSETERTGKMTREVDVHRQYAEYQVNGKSVMIEVKLGQAYAQRIYLYKN